MEVKTTRIVDATFLDIVECLVVNVRVVEHRHEGNTASGKCT